VFKSRGGRQFVRHRFHHKIWYIKNNLKEKVKFLSFHRTEKNILYFDSEIKSWGGGIMIYWQACAVGENQSSSPVDV
jgi:hypothetical protein